MRKITETFLFTQGDNKLEVMFYYPAAGTPHFEIFRVKCDDEEFLERTKQQAQQNIKEMKTLKERDNLDLLELVMELFGRQMHGSKHMHEAYWEARTELERRLATRSTKLPTIYIASPYTLGDPAVNVKRQIDTADELITAGFAPFTPLLSHFQHMIHPRPYEDWTKLDFKWVEVCDCLLRLEGESKGADAEVALALELGKPVFYSVREVVEFYKQAERCPICGRDVWDKNTMGKKTCRNCRFEEII